MKVLFIGVLLSIVIFSSCVSPLVRLDEHRDLESRAREEIVGLAMQYLGVSDIASENETFRNDCSGFVIGVYESLGYKVDFGHYSQRWITDNLYRSIRAKGYVYGEKRPQKGDLAFFRNTVENSGNRITHVGLVTDVSQNGTVLMLHYGSQGISVLRMNLRYPHVHMNERGSVLNDFLRRKSPHTHATLLLSGELFYGYGDLYSYVLYQ